MKERNVKINRENQPPAQVELTPTEPPAQEPVIPETQAPKQTMEVTSAEPQEQGPIEEITQQGTPTETQIPPQGVPPSMQPATIPITQEANIPLQSVESNATANLSKCKDAYLSEEYENYIVQAQKEFYDIVQRLDFACAFPLSPINSVLSVRIGRLNELLAQYQDGVYIEKNQPFTLSRQSILSPSEAANINIFHTSEALKLTGSGTIIGFLDTGIDYLNEEFMTTDKRTRILEIWDQTIEGGTPPKGFNFGSLYTESQINEAIEARRNGGDPYSIVPQRDTIGHGTATAGAAAATGVNIPMGPAPDCSIIAVKLKYAKAANLLRMGIVDPRVPVYDTIDLILAVRYLVETQAKYGKPMVICIPLNSNFGGADGGSPLEKVIDIYAIRRSIVFVTGSGNQGDSGTHTSGLFRATGEIRSVEINIDEAEEIVPIGVFGNSPDKFSIGIVSPTGETIQRFPTKLEGEEVYPFVFEGSTVRVEYSLPDEITGDEVVVIYISNARGGIWKIRLYGDYIVNGRYDVWIPQRELLNGDTRFINPDAYTTVQSPGTAFNIITTAYYNQGNISVEPDSGRGYTRDGRVQPVIATGGVNVVTTFLNNEIITISGSSAAAAVLAGACAMLLEWGVVKGNDTGLYGPTIKAYLLTGADRRQGEVYPNTEWGYGTLNLAGIFENLRGSRLTRGKKEKNDELNKDLFISIPKDIYKRLTLSKIEEHFFGGGRGGR